MPTIVISITGGNETPVEEYEHSEDGSSCPVATRDPELNEENRETAVEEADYRDPSDDGGFRSDEVCGNCGAFDTLTWKEPVAAETGVPFGAGVMPLPTSAAEAKIIVRPRMIDGDPDAGN